MTKTRGIILNAIKYREQDKILYLLTEEGKISVLVRRANRLKEGLVNHTQILSLVEVIYTGDNLFISQDIVALERFESIIQEVEKKAIADFILELLYKSNLEDIDSKLLYHMLVSFLSELSSRYDHSFLLLQIRIKLLYFLGVAPNFKTCAICGRRDYLVGLSILLGSQVCNEHRFQEHLSEEETQVIQYLYRDKEFKIRLEDKALISYLNELIQKYYETHVHLNLKSKSFLMSLNLY